jgi:TolB protein
MRSRKALTAALVAGLVLGVPAAHATFPGPNGRIAFTSDRSGDPEIYTMNADGSDLKRLTNAPGEDALPRWSSDGQRIVFYSVRDGQREVYSMNADGSEQTRLTNNPADDAYPTWSPDGGRIAFSTNRDGEAQREIYVMNADGTGQTRLTDTPPAVQGLRGISEFPLWSAGGRIAFSSIRGGLDTLQLFAMAGDGSNQAQVTNDQVGALLPNWSPDNARLIYYSERSNEADVFVVNADGTGETQLTHTPGEDLAGAWAPDGSKILFTSHRDGVYQLYAMNPDGSGQTRLVASTSNDIGPDWQPNVALPVPKQGETVNVSVLSGTVRVKTRGHAGFQLLSQARQIKVGSQLDTKNGVVRLASAAGKGRTQSGDFGRGVFQVAQSKASKAFTELQLKGGKFSSCSAAAKKGSAAAKKKTIRSLFSKAKGKFRTKGRYSAASVRGTSWLVTDRCDGTLTSVTSGTVSVLDFKRKKTVKVKAGKSYLARAR